MNPRDALLQIAEIRQRMAWAVTFRGYRASTTAATSLVAILAAFAQSLLTPTADFRVDLYLAIWLTAAVLGMAVVAVGIVGRIRRGDATFERSLTIAALESFAPCVLVGALVTYAITYHRGADAFAMLPGLWMVLFSLGCFASRRLLPPAAFLVAGFYLLGGLYCLTLPWPAALSPWTMGGVFGVGQVLTATILHLTLERGEHE